MELCSLHVRVVLMPFSLLSYDHLLQRKTSDSTALNVKGSLPATSPEPHPAASPRDGVGVGLGVGQSPPNVEQMKRMIMKQRARELAESAQKAIVREHSVERLQQEVEALKKEMSIKKQDELIEVRKKL